MSCVGTRGHSTPCPASTLTATSCWSTRRDGGVILLQSTAVVIGDEPDSEQHDHLADVVVAKLAELGGVEVSSDGS